jgi:hypothetical protein
MKGRFRQIERLQAEARRDLPAAALETYAPLREELSALTRAAVRNGLTDAQLLHRIRQLAERTPRLLHKLDSAPLERLLLEHTTRAVISGITSAPLAPPEK